MSPDSGLSLKKCWRAKGNFGDGSCRELLHLIHCCYCPVYIRASREILDRDLPTGYPEDRAVFMARQKQKVNLGTISIMAFRLQEERFALKTTFFQETLENLPVHMIPLKTNRVFRGVVNVNGDLLLCISASELLDLTVQAEGKPTGNNTFERMVVVSREGNRFVFAVNEIFGVERIAPEDIRETPATLSRSARALTRGIFTLKGHNVGLLDEDQFFPAMLRSLSS
ncbi:MAG: chemotaxis protein CheW [Syntrophaceae bacterium]|jgi:chemotaxis-related protein WspD|nr:chemotaxis protein CheW [Syntrophaceae bacterium]